MKYIIGIAINPKLEILLAKGYINDYDEKNDFTTYRFRDILFDYNWYYANIDDLDCEETSNTVDAFDSLEEAQRELVERLFN